MADEWLERGAAQYDSLKRTAIEPWVTQGADEYDRITGGKVQMSLDFGLKQNPDSHAQTQQSAKKLGVPLDMAERNPDEINGIVNRNDIYSKLQDTEFVKKAFEDPNFASVAHDDVDALSKFENTVKALGVGGTQATLGIAESIWRTPESIGRVSDAISQGLGINKLSATLKGMGAPDWLTGTKNPALELLSRGIDVGDTHLAGTSDVADAVGRSTEILGEEFKSFSRIAEKGRAADFAFTAALKGDLAPLADIVTDPEAWAGFIGQAAPSLYMAYKSGGAIPFIAWLESMEVANDAADFEKRTGQKIDPVEFTQAAAQVALVNSFLEKLGLDKVFGQAGKGKLTSMITGAVTEGATEGLQQFNTNVAEYLTFDPNKKLSEGILGSVMGGMGAGGPSGVLSAMGRASGPNSEFAQKLTKSQKAFDDQAKMDAAVESVMEVKTKQRKPEAVKEFVDNILGAESEVFIPAEDADVFFQSHPEIMENLPPEIAESIQESIVTGGDVSITKSDYLTYLSEFHEELSDSLRNDMDGMTAKEANEWVEQGNEQFEVEAERILAEQEMESEFRDSAENVATKIKEQIVQTGRFTEEAAEKYSQLHKAFAVTVAERIGKTPEEVYEQFGLEVRGAPILTKEGAVKALMQAEPTRDQPTDEEIDTFIVKMNEAHRASEAGNKERLKRVLAGLPYDQSQIETLFQLPTETEAFKKWFGESKAVDENGEPLVVYHGSNQSIEQFDIERLGDSTYTESAKQAIFFTNDTRNAGEFAQKAGEVVRADTVEFEKTIESLQKRIEAAEKKGNYDLAEELTVEWENLETASIAAPDITGQNILPIFLSIKNPLIIDYEERTPGREFSKSGKGITDYLSEAKENGNDGVILKNINDSRNDFISDHYAVFEPTQIKSQFNIGLFDPTDPRILFQEGEAPRAQIQFDDGALITLLQDADLSSFLHESGHFFFEAYKNLAVENPEIMEDMQTLLDFVEVDNLETWNSMSLEQRRDGHEKVARAFEAYLFEGKSPNIEMQSLFSRFRDWLLNVYQNLTKLNVELTDEVRQVFDRMLATNEQIREKEVARAYEPLFESAEEAGMTEKQWKDYQNMDERRRIVSESQLQTRSLKDMKWLSKAKGKALKELQKEAKDKRKAMRAEVSEEVSSEPVYRAMNFFRKGELDGVKSDLHKLDQDEFVALFPNVKLPRGMTQKEGLPLNLAAEMLNFTSGDELGQAITTAEPQKARVDRLTDERMLEAYGDLTDPVALERAAEEAIHNEAHTRFLHTELSSMTKRTATGNVLNRAAKQYAEEAISRKKIREIRPFQYSSAEARAAKNAEKSIIQGDRESAAEHKRAQVLNNHFFRAANNAQTETEKMVRYLKKFDREGTRKNIDRDYLGQIDKFLEQYEFRKVSFKELDKRESLAEWIADQENMGFDPVVDEALLDAARKKNYRNMTFEELRGLRDSVKNIEHLGRLKNKMLRQKDKREFSARMVEADESIRENANRSVKERGTPSDVLGKMGSWARNLAAIHRKAASIVREMDGGKDNGVMYNLITQGASESGDNETELTMQDAKKMADIFDPVMGDIHKGGIPGNIYAAKKLIPGTDFSMTKEEVLMFGMNWGNEGNRQRLLDGGMVGRESISNAEAQAILDTLTAKDLAFIQGVLDHIGSKRDEISAQERRLTGVEPQWIEATPIVTKNGTIPGGYFPAKYDVVLSTRSESLDAANDLRMAMKGAFNNSTTRKSYTQKRADEVKGRPIWLNFDTISRHMSEVNHRLSWQDWIVDANRTLKALDAPIREHYGPEILKELRDVVRDVTDGDMQAQHAWEQAVNRFRVGATIVGLGWRFSTALIQPSGLAQSWSRVGSRNMIKGIKQYLQSPLKAGRLADEKSKMMRGRAITMQRETNEVLNTIRAGDSIGKVKASMFVMIQKMQRTVDIPTWWGAYEKALAELEIETAQDQQTRDDIEAKAIAIADQTVKDTQSSGMIFDLAKIQRGSPIAKLFTNFYSYFSATYNLNVETIRKGAKTPSEVLAMASDLFVINIMPVIFSTALHEMLKPECNGDIECLGEKLAEEQISYIMGLTLPTRELGAGVPKLFGLETYEYKGPAGLRPFIDVASLQTQLAQGEADAALYRSLNKVAGAVLHYPAGQVNNTIEGIIAIENGEVEGVGVVQALLAGPPR